MQVNNKKRYFVVKKEKYNFFEDLKIIFNYITSNIVFLLILYFLIGFVTCNCIYKYKENKELKNELFSIKNSFELKNYTFNITFPNSTKYIVNNITVYSDFLDLSTIEFYFFYINLSNDSYPNITYIYFTNESEHYCNGEYFNDRKYNFMKIDVGYCDRIFNIRHYYIEEDKNYIFTLSHELGHYAQDNFDNLDMNSNTQALQQLADEYANRLTNNIATYSDRLIRNCIKLNNSYEECYI